MEETKQLDTDSMQFYRKFSVYLQRNKMNITKIYKETQKTLIAKLILTERRMDLSHFPILNHTTKQNGIRIEIVTQTHGVYLRDQK